MNCESLSNNPSLLQEKSIFCRNLIHTGCFPNGNYDFLSDFKTICKFSSNLIRIEIPVVNFFYSTSKKFQISYFFPLKLFFLWEKYFSVGIYISNVNTLPYNSLSNCVSYGIFGFFDTLSLEGCKNAAVPLA